ncbi:MAG TPA: bacteriohemerythrin [Clostridia bacterium]
MALKWKDTFSCNIHEIDNQHKKLFQIGSNLFELASLKDNADHYDEIMKIINELKDYTIYHFNYEEKLMEEHFYRNYAEHKIEHEAFIKAITKIENSDLDAHQSASVMKLIIFISDWITSHILKTDIQYKDFFNQKGVY